jgi:excisionase family DNA binding protein
MLKNLSATGLPDFVYQANTTLAEIGDAPIYTLSLPKLEPIFKKWMWEISNPTVEAKKPETEKYLTRQDVALTLRMSLPTVDKLIHARILKSKRVGHRVLIHPADLQAALSEIQSTKYRRY